MISDVVSMTACGVNLNAHDVKSAIVQHKIPDDKIVISKVEFKDEIKKKIIS